MTDISPDTGSETPRPRRPRGPALSAERIADEALRLIDAGGLDGFSFRILAGRLGVQAMSLYNYFPSKQHLFEALVDICLAEASDWSDGGTWQDRMRRAATAYRRMALNHPGFFLYLATFRMNNRAGLTYLDRVLKIFEDSGLPPEQRARHFRVMGYYLVGACIDETLGYANGPGATDPVGSDQAARDFPAIITVGAWFGSDHHERTFALGIDALIAAIEADLAAFDRQ